MKTIIAQFNLRRRRRDYITNLPEPLLTDILSRLPTKDAVRTSTLSKAWVTKWTSVDNVDFNDKNLVLRHKLVFANFMDRILRTSPFLTRYCLRSRTSYSVATMQTWILTALARNIEILRVHSARNDFVLPNTLLNSTSLQQLYMFFSLSILNVAAQNYAPNLTSLSLWRIRVVNEDRYTRSMTFSFPSLETFRASECKWLNVKTVELYAPSLTSFQSTGYKYLDTDYDYSFVINAPRLAKFKCSGIIPEKFDVICGSSVVSADLFVGYIGTNSELFTTIGSRIAKVLSQLTNLVELALTMSEVLTRMGPRLRHNDKLRTLNLWSDSQTSQLLTLLDASPLLKLLAVNVTDWIDYDYGSIERVPSCIASHLEEVEITCFECETPQYNLVKFLVENGDQLKKITFVGPPDSVEEKTQVKDYISAIRNVDTVCFHHNIRTTACIVDLNTTF